MELSHEFTVPASVEETWAAFNDIASVAGCFPGAQVTSVEGDEFTGTCKVKLGPIALVYTGSGTFVEKDEAAHRFVVEARGKDKRGNGTAGAKVTATMQGTGDSTDVSVVTDLAITGKPAQFGRGVMQDVSDKLLQQFVDCLQGRVGAAASSTAAASSPSPTESSSGSAGAAAGSTAGSSSGPAGAAAGSTAGSSSGPAGAAAGSTAGSSSGSASGAETASVAESAADGVPAGSGAATGGAHAAPTPSSSDQGPSQAPAQHASNDNDALDLGATVLPVLARSYWKQALGVVVVIALIIWWIAKR